MKKKILFLIVIIILSFIVGICIKYFTSPKENITVITDPERNFDSTNIVAVSNSDPRGNKHIFKSFFAYDTTLNLESFSKNDEFYYKKITSYLEYLDYKAIIPELRTLTREDFINYYLIIAMSDDIDYIYMLNDVEKEENSLSLEILKNQILSETAQTPIYTGVSIVLPNTTEVPIENINLFIKQ